MAINYYLLYWIFYIEEISFIFLSNIAYIYLYFAIIIILSHKITLLIFAYKDSYKKVLFSPKF